MKFMDVFRFCKRCAKSALFAEIDGDGFCAKCRDEIIREAQAKAEEEARLAAESAERRRRLQQKCQKCGKNGLEVEIETGSICNTCRAKYPRIRDELHAKNHSYRQWFLCSLDHIRYSRKRFISVDLETTGLSTWTDRIIELSAVLFENFEPVAEFSTLVNPERHIWEDASRVNGIYDKDVKDAPFIYEAIANFCDFIGEDALTGKIPLVAHNASFDAGFLLEAFNDCGVTADLLVMDTLHLSQHFIPDLYRHRLADVAKHFGIKQKNAHRAADDARVCGEVYCKIMEMREQRLLQKKAELTPMELEICEWFKKELDAADINTQFFTVSLGKTFCAVKCISEVLRIKGKGKNPYILIPDSWEVPSGLETGATTKSEGEVNVRLYFNEPSDLYPLRDNLVRRYESALDACIEQINSSVRAFQLASEKASHEISL